MKITQEQRDKFYDATIAFKEKIAADKLQTFELTVKKRGFIARQEELRNKQNGNNS